MRRAWGIFLLALTLVAGAAAARLTAPDATGAGSAVPITRPVEGDCATVLLARVYVVPCSDRHTGEVAVVYPEQQALTLEAAGELTADCRSAAAAYVPVPTVSPLAGWAEAKPQSLADVWRGPGWRACLTVFSDGAYAGSVRDADGAGIYGLCQAVRIEVSCDRPHDSQLLGETTINGRVVMNGSSRPVLADPEVEARVTADCRSLAATLLDRADPSAGGRLQFVLESSGMLGTVTIQPGTLITLGDGDAEDPAGIHVTDAVFGCVARYSGPGKLVGSLLALGDRPLPVR